MQRVEVGGLSIAYERTGDGPALVLLHGFSIDSRVWRPQLEGLLADFTVLAWDAPGAGGSSDPPDGFRLHDWADCLAGFLDAVGLRSAHVVGLSWGGILAQEFYRRHARRVGSLVLVDTYAGWKGSLPDVVTEQRLAACLRDSDLPPEEFVPKYLPSMFGATPHAEIREELARIMFDFHPAGFRLMALSSADTDTRSLLAQIDVPTLLVWGAADARSPIAVAHQFREAIPGARLAVIPGAGHVSNLEAATAFNAEIRNFCLPIPLG